MENRFIFREMLSEIKAAADARGDVISRDEVREILSGMPLTEEHYELIYEYLEQQNIRVVQPGEETDAAGDAEDAGSLSAYLTELARLQEETFEDEHALLRRVMQGDVAAKARLIESYLPLICEAAGNYEGDELFLEDLIQEGNLGLLVALESLDQFDSPAACSAHIFNSINEAMSQAIAGSREKKEMGDHLVSRVNHLNEAVKNLERDLEHKVSAEELSAYLEMPLQEIRDILRMSGDQIELEDGRTERERRKDL